MIGKSTTIKLTIGVEGASEILLKDVGGNDFLALLILRIGLGVVLAHVGIISGNKTNDALLALVANIDTYQHSLSGDLWAEAHAPQVTSKLSIDLTDDVEVDAIVISVDGLAGNELRDNGVVRVNFIFNGGVEDLLPHGVGDDDKEELNDWLLGLILGRGLTLLSNLLDIDVVPEVGVNSVLEVLDR